MERVNSMLLQYAIDLKTSLNHATLLCKPWLNESEKYQDWNNLQQWLSRSQDLIDLFNQIYIIDCK